MDPRIPVLAAGLAFALAPIAYFDEFGLWGFEEPVSNLAWDEAQMAPQGASTAGVGSGGGGDAAPDDQKGGSGSGGSRDSSSDDGGSGGSGPGGPGGSAGSGGDGRGSGRAGLGGSGLGSRGMTFNFLSGFGMFCGGAAVCFAFWSHAWAAAFAAMWASFAAALACALALLFYALMWYYLAIWGGLVSVGITGLAVYLHSQGMLFAPRK